MVNTAPGGLAKWWLDRLLRSKGLAFLAPPVLVLVITLAVSFVVERYQVALRHSATPLNAMAFQSGLLLTQMLNAETGMRGYAATADPAYLAVYTQSANGLPTQLDALVTSESRAVSAGEATTVRSLGEELLSKLSGIKAGVAAGFRPLPGLSSSTPSASCPQAQMSALQVSCLLTEENALMTVLRGDLANAQTAERAAAASKAHQVNELQSALQPVQIVGLLVGLIGGLAAMVLFVRSIVRRMGDVGANARRLGLSEPLQPIPPAADELGQLADELRQTATLLTQRSTDLVRAHASAVAAAAGADALLAQLGHELRTPLTAVMGFGHLMETSDLHGEDAESLAQILQGANHMLRIIEQARTPSTASHSIDVDLGPVDVGPLVREVRALLSPLSASRQLTVTGGDDVTVSVLADYHRFKQVLINLLSNAVKYNRDGGHVSITCDAARDGMVRVAVTDTGDGIAPELIDRVFVPFDRLDADERGVEGTGIGLSLSRTFVEAMNGTIGVQSTVGTGSTFWVELPSPPRSR